MIGCIYMTIKDIKATSQFVDVRNGGAIVYETDVETDGPGVILTDNPNGEYSVALLSTFHPGGRVKVIMKGVQMSGNKAYKVGDVIGKLVIF